MNRKGFSFLEFSAGLLLMGILTGYAIAGGARQQRMATQMKVWREMTSIADAAVDYYYIKGVWPDSIKALDGYLSGLLDLNPWGRLYIISADQAKIRVLTSAPIGSVPFASTVAMGSIERLENGESQFEVVRPIPLSGHRRLVNGRGHVF